MILNTKQAQNFIKMILEERFKIATKEEQKEIKFLLKRFS